jgi:hypothetical protein
MEFVSASKKPLFFVDTLLGATGQYTSEYVAQSEVVIGLWVIGLEMSFCMVKMMI